MIFFACYIFVLIFVLNPYTYIGPLAGFFVLPFFFYVLIKKNYTIDRSIFLASTVFIVISYVGVMSSLYHNIFQLEHLKVSLSIFIYLIVGFGFGTIFIKKNWPLNYFLYLCVLVVFLNSIIILLEVIYPGLRTLIESLLVPSGNVDWTEGFRFRGLASGGGASLSVLTPVVVIIALHLFQQKYIGAVSLLALILVLVSALFFIGRTGVLLLPLPFIIYLLLYSRKQTFSIIFLSVLLLGSVLSFSDFFKEFMISQFGVGFYNYSLGFFLEGSEGVKNEGTVGIIMDFLTVVPTTFPEFLIGYGFYGGSEFTPWTDSGFSRMFLSVGYFFGVLFYSTILYLVMRVYRIAPFLVLSIFLVLLISETKESLLVTGYSARLFFVIIGFLFALNKIKKHKECVN